MGRKGNVIENQNKHGSRESLSQEERRWKASRLKENLDGNEEAEMNGLNLTAERRNENCGKEERERPELCEKYCGKLKEVKVGK